MDFLLDGNSVTPKNYEEIELVIDKTRKGSDSSMNLTQLIFVNEAKKQIDDFINLNGNFQGIPLDIQLNNGFTINYYLDTTDEPKFQDHSTELAVKRRYANAQFWEKANYASFFSLGSPTITSESKRVGRVVITVDEHLQSLNFGLSFLDIVKSTIEIAYDLSNLTAAGLGIGTVIYALIMIGVYLTKLVNLVLQISIFMQELKNYIIPPIEQFLVTSIKELFYEYLPRIGYQLNENQFINQFDDIVYLGTAYKQPISTTVIGGIQTYKLEPRLPYGYPTVFDLSQNSQYQFDMVGGFIDWFLDTFNAKIRVDSNNVVTFNKFDENIGTTNGITTGLTIQSTRVSEYTPNTNEAWQRCLINYELDDSDRYTSYLFEDSATEYASLALGKDTSLPQDLTLIRGVKKVSIPFSQGFAFKITPTPFWNILSKLKPQLGGVFSSAIESWVNDALNGGVPYADLLATSSYNYNRPKLLRHLGGLKSEHITTDWIFDNFHVSSFIGNNSFLIYNGEITECNDDLFVSLLNNDYAEINGVICEIVRVSYSPYSHKANIIYKQPSNYADNLSLVKII